MPRKPIRPERFTWTEGDLVFPSCLTCRHKSTTGATCTAFPEGIPMPILDATHDHRTPYAGDGGVQYEAAP
jgi:hypothetical protein